jgi:hypothetical protein
MKFSDDELLKYNQMGLIPGPDEPEEDFVKRVHYCLGLKTELSAKFGKIDNQVSRDLILQVAPKTRELFDIVPEWVPIVFSNEQLAYWHGGCAWIFQQDDETPMGAFFQLREVFAKKDRYLGLYDRKEIVAHETAHVGRMLFHEPKFEEMLAYRTSPSWLRRWIGPIVQASWESLTFVAVLLLALVMDFFILIMDKPDPYHMGMWFKIIPAILLFVGLGRLGLQHLLFHRCLQKLQGLLHDPVKANAVIYRLRDREIGMFGEMEDADVLQYIKTEEERSLRWRVISKAYFSSLKK